MASVVSNKKFTENSDKAEASVHSREKTGRHLDWNKLFHGEFALSKAIAPQDILNAWRQFSKATYREWERFVNGADNIDSSIIPPEVLGSWQLCRKKNLDPLAEPYNPVLTGSALQKLMDENELFVSTSQPFLNRLYRFMRTTSFILSLFDRNGYLLQVMQEDKYLEIMQTNKWYPGVQWTEEYGGNNSVGSVIKLKKPLQILGPQHYLKRCHSVTTSSAPIFGPEGELLGGITIIAVLYGTHPHTLGMAIAAAHAIENEIKTQIALIQRNEAFHETDIMADLQQAIATYIPDALIALNNEGRIYAINEMANKMFGFRKNEFIGQYLRHTPAGKENPPLVDLIDTRESVSDRETHLQTAHGSGDYSVTCNSVKSRNGSVIGKIIVAQEIKRIRSLVTKFIGSNANFHFSDIRSQNHEFKKIIDHAVIVSESSSNVLLLGESGTGKDIMAQAIHNASSRKDGPYIAINCAAIPRDQIASELFGHEEGGFTGSRRGGNQGKFELADGGTIFLDEIAEMPLEIQAVLLRVIEDKRFIRIGGRQVHAVDVRIISATNKDLIDEVNKGNFRKDLYYRLNVFNINLPPLRDRTDDIALLVNAFIKKYATALGKTIDRVDQKVWDVFLRYSWPGNIRELQNIIERMVNYASSDCLTPDLVPPEIVGIRHTYHRSIDPESPEETEKRLIRHLLTLNFNRTKIARQLNMSRATLYRKMIKYRLLEKKALTEDISSQLYPPKKL